MARWRPPAFWFCQDCAKNCYRDEETARHFAGISQYHGSILLRVYACPSGRGFHLTSKENPN